MYAAPGEGGSGHERAHDPCRADWVDVAADHPAWPARARLTIALATLTITAAAGIVWGLFTLIR